MSTRAACGLDLSWADIIHRDSDFAAFADIDVTSLHSVSRTRPTISEKMLHLFPINYTHCLLVIFANSCGVCFIVSVYARMRMCVSCVCVSVCLIHIYLIKYVLICSIFCLYCVGALIWKDFLLDGFTKLHWAIYCKARSVRRFNRSKEQ